MSVRSNPPVSSIKDMLDPKQLDVCSRLFDSHIGRKLGMILQAAMGTGKSRMSLYVMFLIKGIVLLLLPLSLIDGWIEEINKVFAESELPQIFVYHATQRKESLDAFVASLCGKWAIVISTADTFRVDKKVFIQRTHLFSCMFIDEVHLIRNQTTLTYKALHEFRMNKIGITGTIVIYDASRDIKNAVSLLQPEVSFVGKDLDQICRDHVIARSKGQMGVPERTFEKTMSFVKLTDDEKATYLDKLSFLKMKRKELLDLKRLPQFHPSKIQALKRYNLALSDIKKSSVCCQISELKKSQQDLSLVPLSSVLSYAFKKYVHLQEQAIMFCEYVTPLMHLAAHFQKAGRCDVAIYSGELSSKRRTEIIHRFKRGEITLLLLTNAGGVGLNLPGVLLVVMLDTSYSKQTMSQLIARVDRRSDASTATIVVDH